MTGITISSKQVEIANRLTKAAAESESQNAAEFTSAEAPGIPDADGFIRLGSGKVRFLELDAEKMAGFFGGQEGTFGTVWISEALSHFPNKPLFFENAKRVLNPGGKLVLADWFKAENLDETTFVNDIKPIEGKGFGNYTQICILTKHRWHASASSLYATGLCRFSYPSRTPGVRGAEGYQPGSPKNMVNPGCPRRHRFKCLQNSGTLHGHSYRTPHCGRSLSPKAAMALLFCSRSGP